MAAANKLHDTILRRCTANPGAGAKGKGKVRHAAGTNQLSMSSGKSCASPRNNARVMLQAGINPVHVHRVRKYFIQSSVINCDVLKQLPEEDVGTARHTSDRAHSACNWNFRCCELDLHLHLARSWRQYPGNKCPTRPAMEQWRRSVEIYCGDFELKIVAALRDPEVGQPAILRSDHCAK
jgi:hypothetical protein